MSARVLDGLTRSQRFYARHRESEKARSDAYRRAHLSRYAEIAADRYQANPEAARAAKRAQYLVNPEPYRLKRRLRARRTRAAWVEPVVSLVVMEIGDGICGICGEDIPIEEFSVDHILPLAAGGEHSYENVQAAHLRCNKSKRAA